MTEEEMKQQTSATTPEGTPATPEAPAVAPEGTPAEEPEQTPAPSVRDSFRDEYAKRYPDDDLSDDDAYVNHLRGKLKERDDYEGVVSNLTNSIKGSDVMAEMMAEAGKEHTDEEGNPVPFDPILWAVENGKLDFEALGSDPEYAKKLAEARKKSLATISKQKELEEASKENVQPSIDTINSVADNLGLSEDQKLEAVRTLYQIMDELIVDKISPETFEMICKGMVHDDDVAQAEANGHAQGMATKVSDKLRTLPDRPERTGGRQIAPKEQTEEEKPKARNMFGL